MEETEFLTAEASIESGTKVVLNVSGKVMAYSSNAKITARPESGDLNPTFFGVAVLVEEGDGPRKGVLTGWKMSEVIDSADRYRTAMVRAYRVEGGDREKFAEVSAPIRQ